jgi:Zn-dependent M28 family amino/carboxypeptidase
MLSLLNLIGRTFLMHRTLLLVSAALVLGLSVPAQEPAAKHFDGNSWWSHVKVLADDNMEGRETGSEGLHRAEAYVVEQLTKSGLTPAGTKGFYQPIKFVQRQIDETNSSAALITGVGAVPLVLGEDAYFGSKVESAPEGITAPLAFVGNGLKVPEKNHDDLAGLDLKGKIVVYLAGSPSNIAGGLAAHYSSLGERWKSLRDAGAIGYVVIPNPASMDIPWSRMSLNRTHPSMDLADPEFNEISGLKFAMTFNPANAEKLFAGSGHTFADLASLAKDRKLLPHFPLAVSLRVREAIKTTQLESSNIVAVLPGTDPLFKNEYVVLTAHIDHIGIGEPINGDRIYNGAMDDGSGSALLLDVAASLKAHPELIRRSILFVFVTAEEKGLLGSKYFTAHPNVDARLMIADINVDMFLPIVPLKILRVQGFDDTDLADRAGAIAKSHGVKAVGDPEPLRNLLVRSDQYNFIRHGIPSIIMDVFYEPGSPESKLFKDWLTNRYHAPSDDINQPVDLGAAALYEEIVRQLLISTANARLRPRWQFGSFFSRYASPQH